MGVVDPVPLRRSVGVPAHCAVLEQLRPAHRRRVASPLGPPFQMWVATQVAARLSLQPHLFSLSSRYRGVPDAGHGQGQLDQMLRALHPAAQRPLKSADPAVRALRRAIDRGHDAKKGPNWTAQPAPPRPPPLRRRQDREAVAITATVPAAWRNSSCPRCPPARLLRPNASRGESKKVNSLTLITFWAQGTRRNGAPSSCRVNSRARIKRV